MTNSKPLSLEPAKACLCHTPMAGEVSQLLGGLANELRLLVVALLREVDEMHVNDIVERLEVNRIVLSRHLSRLRDMDVVTTRRHHNRIYYTLNHEKAGRIVAALGLDLAPLV
mgnify:CR=1 FL=1